MIFFFHSWLLPTPVLTYCFPNYRFSWCIKPGAEIASPLLDAPLSLPHNTENDCFPEGSHQEDLSETTRASWKFSRVPFFFLMKENILLNKSRTDREVGCMGGNSEIYYNYISHPGAQQKVENPSAKLARSLSRRAPLQCLWQGSGNPEEGWGHRNSQL